VTRELNVTVNYDDDSNENENKRFNEQNNGCARAFLIRQNKNVK